MSERREKKFWYFTELKRSSELEECREKYLTERSSNPDLTFPQFAAQYMGRLLPILDDVFAQLKKKDYNPQTPPIKDGSGAVIAQDMSSELYQAVSFWVNKPISEEDSKSVADLGFELSQ